MLRAQRLIPRMPPRLLAPAICARWAAQRFVDWSFDHYLRIAPPEFAAPRGRRDRAAAASGCRRAA